ncbi:MAG TPA: hypothetical protein VHL80_06010 [Polyangia bacterium]|nr:hypothetical protein [Polyangia bacterium]
MRQLRLCAAALSLLVAACATTGAPASGTGRPQEGRLSPDAPADRPFHVAGKSPAEALASWRALIAPYVEKAWATYPDAKRRYLAGLPPGETFFVTTILADSAGRFEQVFILVDRIEDGVVTGRIFSDVATVHGFKPQDVYRFKESEIVDWLISKPDGSEEGNLVGKFIDNLPRRSDARL